jgi:hypothetical protein
MQRRFPGFLRDAWYVLDTLSRLPVPLETFANALQWRLQYNRVIQQAGTIEGILQIT